MKTRPEPPSRRVILAGGSGFLGQFLAHDLALNGYRPVVLARHPLQAASARSLRWDGQTLGPWQEEFEGAAAVINLAGRSVNCRYNPRNRAEIMNSRVDSTRVIGEAIAGCVNPPPVWLNASTATIYKHTFEHPMDESGEIGATPEARDEFSIRVACAWEAELAKAPAPRTRKVALRTAMVLGPGANSVFPVLRRLVRFRLGGKMGTGQQFVSWIHHRDFCAAIRWLLERTDLAGTFNLAAPAPLTNDEMMRTLRRLSGVSIGLPATEWMLELGAIFLRTETELILKSRRVVPRRLTESGFRFQFPEIRGAFADLLRPARDLHSRVCRLD